MAIGFAHFLLIFYSNFTCLRGDTVVAPRFLRCWSDQPQLNNCRPLWNADTIHVMFTAVKKYFLPIQKDCVSLQFEN